MLPMPLRPSEAYRSQAGTVLDSISRRWLYNIPYSLQTEGLRPLGRLALVDHFKRLLDRSRQAISRITNETSIAATAQHTGLKFVVRPPRVFVVASISGGTGSGMVLDVAYAARSVLAELGLSDEHVYGILMHGEPVGSGDRDKAIANAYAALNELWNYLAPRPMLSRRSRLQSASVPRQQPHVRELLFGALGRSIDRAKTECSHRSRRGIPLLQFSDTRGPRVGTLSIVGTGPLRRTVLPSQRSELLVSPNSAVRAPIFRP